jgi:hypothetical protein
MENTENPDFGVKLGKGENKVIPKVSINSTPKISLFLIAAVIILGIAGTFFYFVNEGYFKVEINQSQSVEPQINISSPVDIENTYSIKNNHTIINEINLIVTVDGNEVNVEIGNESNE